MNLNKLTFKLAISFMLGCFLLNAQNRHVCTQENIPELVSRYTLVDIGETDIDSSRLAIASNKLTLAPKINRSGLVLGNTSKGGFITYPGKWMFAPQFEGMTINFHAINSHGDLLIAIMRGNESVEWMRWPCIENNYGTGREHIQTIDPFTSKFFVTGFNDENKVIAYGPSANCTIRPFEWVPQCKLEKLGACQDLDIQGTAIEINTFGTVAGIFNSIVDQTPYVWNPACGLIVMNHYRQYLDPTGWVEFVDLHLTDDNVVYGTYVVKHLADTIVSRGHYYETRQSSGCYYQHNAFVWNPACAQISMLDLQGMRITGVNKEHILVGSLQENAMIRLPGKEAVQLASLIDPDEVKDWKLLEITDINDQGQVVGYGWYKNKTHLFLANPLR